MIGVLIGLLGTGALCVGTAWAICCVGVSVLDEQEEP